MKKTIILKHITFLIRDFYQMQEHRIAMGNQLLSLSNPKALKALKAKEKKQRKEEIEVLNYFYEKFHLLEKELEKEIHKNIKDHPMWSWLKEVKGIGPLLGAALLSNIDITRADHASSVWKFCGLAVDPETGRAERLQAGKKASYNPEMKTICWKIGESFVKTKGKYRGIYDTSKLFYQKKFPKTVFLKNEKDEFVKNKQGKKIKVYTKGHIHAMSKRRTVKLFLSHLWVSWREMEGLSVSEPFSHRGLDNSVNK